MVGRADGHPVRVPVARQAPLAAVLAEGRSRGLIGPRDLADQITHAEGFVPGLGAARRLVDLGSGGGLPGLVVACCLEDADIVLVDAAARRCRFLHWAVSELDLGDRVSVVNGRAEEIARDDRRRMLFEAVTSRSFGPPAVTAECGRGFLRAGGVMVVSDPPDDPVRWYRDGLASLALVVDRSYRSGGGAFTVLRAEGDCPDSIPRRVGIPQRRPRF